MTATRPAPPTDALATRLAALREERNRAQAEVIPDRLGDAADRASNVDAEVRLAMIDQRIRKLELEFDAALRSAGQVDAADDVVGEGDIVSVDLGDGPETFRIGAVELASDGIDVITPKSPLGQALLGACAGATVTYQTASRKSLHARVVSVG